MLLSAGIAFGLLFVMFAMTPLFVEDDELRTDICGYLCSGICIAMYGTPCLEALKAVRYRDASRLSMPLAIAGSLNGALWGTYGLALGNPSIFVPNLLGFGLSIMNVIVKACLGSKVVVHESAESLLQTASSEHIPVLIHSLAHNAQLHVKQSAPGGNESNASEMQVCSAAAGIAINVILMPSGCVAFRLADGRFLRVCPVAEGSLAKVSCHQPSSFTMVAKFVQEPGPDNEFQVLPGSGVALHHSEQKMAVYGSETVSFWSPLHQVFLRLNELGDFDCSPPLAAAPDGKIRLPGGWHWERFCLQRADAAVDAVV